MRLSKHLAAALLPLASLIPAAAQNLVLDPGFENWTGTPGAVLPSANMLLPLNPGWYEANGSADCVHLNNATGVTPGWLNPGCPLGNGQIQCGTPHNGSGVLGCYKGNGAAGTKEWAATALASPMVPGQTYRVGYWIQNKYDRQQFIMETNQWGMFFSTTALPSFNPNTYSFTTAPNDWVTCTQLINDTIWHYLEWCFVPQQAYTHIYLGYVGDVINSTVNAWSNSGSVGFYVWIDDVVVEAINPTLTVIPDMTICTGDSVQLWASSDLALSWDGGATTDTAIWVSPGTTTTYYVQTLNQGACQLIDSVTVTVVGCNCNIVLQNAIAGTNDAGCPGVGCNGSALVTPQNGAAPYSFVWDDPSAQTVANAVGLCAGTYSCAVMDADGCMDTVSVTLQGPTFPTLSSSVTDETCLGLADGAVDLSVSGGLGPFSYLWSNTALTQDLAGIGGGTYSVEVTDGYGCVHNDTAVVDPGPAPAVANIAAAGPYCDSDPPDALSATPAGGTWSGTGIDPATGTFDPAIGAGSYTAYYTLPSSCSVPDSLVLVVETTPVAAFTASPTSGCVPLTVNFQPVGLLPGQQCTWSFGDGNTSGQNGPLSYTYTLAGPFDVALTVTNAAGCSDVLTQNDLVTVSPLPPVQFAVEFPGGPFVGQPVSFSDATATPVISWDWLFGDGDGAQGESVEHVYNEDGSYPVTLTVVSDSGCVASVTEVVTIRAESAVYMPNAFSPDGDGVNEVLRPELQGIATDFYELLVFDRWGQRLFSTKDASIAWNGTFNNGGVAVPTGVYVWRITARSAYGGDRFERTGHVMLLR